MLHHLMGRHQLINGMAYYFQTYKDTVTDISIFVACLEEIYRGEENLTRLIDTWVSQSGFPVVKVERINNTYYIEQSRFVTSNSTIANPFNSRYL